MITGDYLWKNGGADGTSLELGVLHTPLVEATLKHTKLSIETGHFNTTQCINETHTSLDGAA